MNLLCRCFEPLLKFKQCQILASAINEDLMIKVKQSLAALKSMFSPANKKGKKAMTKDNTQVVKTEAMEEISKLTQYFQNISLMQNETARLQDSLTTETDQLNKEIQAEFDQFRKNPTKIKKFEQADKDLVLQHLNEFENSEDEDQVDLEEIQVNDGKYQQFALFSQNIRKFQKMIVVKQIIKTIKKKKTQQAQPK